MLRRHNFKDIINYMILIVPLEWHTDVPDFARPWSNG